MLQAQSQNLIEEAKAALYIAETWAKGGSSAKRGAANARPKVEALHFQEIHLGQEEDTLMAKHNYAVFKLGEKDKKSLEVVESILNKVL